MLAPHRVTHGAETPGARAIAVWGSPTEGGSVRSSARRGALGTATLALLAVSARRIRAVRDRRVTEVLGALLVVSAALSCPTTATAAAGASSDVGGSAAGASST